MNVKKLTGFNNHFKVLTLFSVVFLLLISNLFGVFSYNRSCEAFWGECPGEAKSSNANATPSLCPLIVKAAGFYIKSLGNYQTILSEIEFSDSNLRGFQFSKLQETINNTIDCMKTARSAYYALWRLSLSKEYNPAILDKLCEFDYSVYQKENNLNPFVFSQVADFLENGDIRGTYKRAHTSTSEILQRLENIKISFDKDMIPQLSELWRLNQLYMDTMLFGQYVSEIFFAITK